MRILIVLPFVVSGCSAIFPTVDAGPTPDASTDVVTESAACVDDYVGCTATSVCCDPTYACNASGICSPVCLTVNSVCSSSSQCCSGICMGTCQ
jgi:hypothetical protein